MNIGTQIKQRRNELNMTQEELSKKLNVSRSTVSNWEIGRNYPDIQLIVSISDVLGIPLEELLVKDSDVVKKIANDTKETKWIKKKIKILYIVLVAIIVIPGALFFFGSKELTEKNEISQVSYDDNGVYIQAKLPFFRSLDGYFVNPDGDDLEISLFTKFSLKHTENIRIAYPEGFSGKPKYVFFVNSKDTAKGTKVRAVPLRK